MLNPNAKKWVEALRSGEFKQGYHWLRKEHKGQFYYCCLGVVMELAVRKGVVKEFVNGSSLTEKVRAWVGLTRDFGDVPEPHYRKDTDLMYLNDRKKLTFAQIADFIESEPEGLFVKGGEKV